MLAFHMPPFVHNYNYYNKQYTRWNKHAMYRTTNIMLLEINTDSSAASQVLKSKQGQFWSEMTQASLPWLKCMVLTGFEHTALMNADLRKPQPQYTCDYKLQYLQSQYLDTVTTTLEYCDHNVRIPSSQTQDTGQHSHSIFVPTI